LAQVQEVLGLSVETSKGGPLRPAFLSFTTSLLEVEDVE